MMTIEELWNDIHKRARHRGDSVIIDIIIQNGIPIVERRKCPCIVLFQALKENNIANMLFGYFNEPTLSLVFEELAEVPSDVVETMGSQNFLGRVWR